MDSQTIPDELVTCIAVMDDRHQHFMSSVVLMKGIEEPWASERVARFIDSLVYKEITLKSDTEPAVIAFRNRVAENCNAEVTLEDAVKGDKAFKRIGREHSDVVARCHQKHHMWRVARKKNTEKNTQSCRGWWNMREHFVQVLEGSRRSDVIRKIAWQEFYTRVCAIRREGAGETNTLRTVEQNESQIQVRSVAGSERNSSAVCFVETVEGVFTAREVRRTEHQDRWDKEAINNVIGVSWRIADEIKKDSGQVGDAN